LDYDILPSGVARVYSVVLPWTELTLALALIMGLALRLVACVIAALLISFVIAIVINLRRSRILECHCYGVLSATTIGWGTVVRDVVLLALAIILFALAPNIISPMNWFSNLKQDVLLFFSVNTVLPLGLLVAFGFLTLRLIEEGVNLGHRVSQPRSSSHGSPHAGH